MADLSKISAGQTVLIAGRLNQQPREFSAPVDRVTPTLIVCGDVRFSRKTGIETGTKTENDRRRVRRILGLESAIKEERRRRPLIDRLLRMYCMDWQRLSTVKLEMIVAALDA